MSRLWVERIALTSFRNYPGATITAGPEPVVLVGPNGAGKTNFLEAISLLSPGQGLRRANFTDLSRAENPLRATREPVTMISFPSSGAASPSCGAAASCGAAGADCATAAFGSKHKAASAVPDASTRRSEFDPVMIAPFDAPFPWRFHWRH